MTASVAGSFGGSATEVNVALGEPGAHEASPVTGTIVSYRLEGEGHFALRVIRPATGGAYTGVSSSALVTASTYGLHSFSTSLPIRAGDLIGLDLGETTDIGTDVSQAEVTGSTVYEWGNNGFLADGATAPPKNVYPDFELLFNAEVVASNTVVVGTTQRNKKNGTATLNLTVPNPGTLTASSNGARVSSTTSQEVAAGPVQVLIKATGKKKRSLNRTGKVKVNVALAYAPTLGDPGQQSVKVKLKKKLKR
jgi:hypothetical protein